MRKFFCLILFFFAIFLYINLSYASVSESINRRIYSFNRGFDKSFSDKCLYIYINILPSCIDVCVSNFFKNVLDIHNMFFYFLLNDIEKVSSFFNKFILNFFFGLCGFCDVYKIFGSSLDSVNFQNFLSQNGYNKVQYMMLPIIGPGTVIFNCGLVIEHLLNPFFYFFDYLFIFYFFEVLNKKSLVFFDGNFFHSKMVDGYIFLKDIYLQNNEKFLISDLDFLSEPF